MSLENEFLKLDKRIERIQDKRVKELARKHKKILEDTRKILNDKYIKYANEDGQLTFAEMAKYNRKKNLDKELEDAVRELYRENGKVTRSGLKQIYRTGFTEGKGIIEDEIGRVIRGKVKTDVINAAIQNPISGLTLNQRLEKNRRNLIYQIQESVGRGLVDGEEYRAMQKKLKDSFEGDLVKTNRIVRTEGHRVSEQATFEAMERAEAQGVEMRKYWLDSGDDRVRDTHDNMGEKYDRDNAIPIDEDFVNNETGGSGPVPGQLRTEKDDINCRCIAVYVPVVEN